MPNATPSVSGPPDPARAALQEAIATRESHAADARSAQAKAAQAALQVTDARVQLSEAEAQLEAAKAGLATAVATGAPDGAMRALRQAKDAVSDYQDLVAAAIASSDVLKAEADELAGAARHRQAAVEQAARAALAPAAEMLRATILADQAALVAKRQALIELVRNRLVSASPQDPAINRFDLPTLESWDDPKWPRSANPWMTAYRALLIDPNAPLPE